MTNIQIIYTPETNHFRLDDPQMYGSRQPGDPLLDKLRTNYRQLRDHFQELPIQVGIVTYDFIFKREASKMLQELREDSQFKHSTTFTPLDILETALDLRKEDITDPISQEYVYRTLMYLMMNSSVNLDRSLPPDLQGKVPLISTIPSVEYTSRTIRGDLEKVRAEAPSNDFTNEVISRFEKAADELAKFVSWDDLEAIYTHFKRKFEVHKVSREFPLFFFPPDYSFPGLYTVSLVDEIETPDYIPKLLEILQLGAEAQGLHEIPEAIKKQAMIGQKDKFGETKRIWTLDELLPSLPEPKTIITDIYIVDQFPQLTGTEFETHEFRLE